MSEFAIMPLAHYQSACNEVRSITGSTDKIKSEELQSKITKVYGEGYNHGWGGGYSNGKGEGQRIGYEQGYSEGYEAGLAEGETDLTELLSLQENYIYGGVDDLLHIAGYEQTADGDYITGIIPFDVQSSTSGFLIAHAKNLIFDDESDILFIDDGAGGRWVRRNETNITDLDNGYKAISPTFDDPFTQGFRLRFKSYRFIPIVTIP